jgi:cell division septation protein DedD
MTNYLKLLCFIFLGIGVLFSLSIFALKFFFYNDYHEELIVLGPGNLEIISKPLHPKGLKVPNLDIEILNNEKALIENKKIRPLPVKPELLPIEVKQEISKQDLKNDKIKTNKVKVNSQPNIKTIQKPVIKENSSLYRVQFGSFRNIEKAKNAMVSMTQQHKLLLSDVKLEIFTFKNTKNFLFHRVWTLPISKKNGLKLCDEFKLKNIVCILQPNK